jgi:hypothetical protein
VPDATFAEQIGMPLGAVQEVLYELRKGQYRASLQAIRKELWAGFGVKMSHAQWAALKKYAVDHPQED